MGEFFFEPLYFPPPVWVKFSHMPASMAQRQSVRLRAEMSRIEPRLGHLVSFFSDFIYVHTAYTVDFGYKGPHQLVHYIRMSLITDGNYVHFGEKTDRKCLS